MGCIGIGRLIKNTTQVLGWNNMYATGSLRRVKKFDIVCNEKKGEYSIDLLKCSRGQFIALPLHSTGYHRGLDRTLGLFCKQVRDKGLITDKEIIDTLLESKTLHPAKTVALIATWQPKKVEKK